MDEKAPTALVQEAYVQRLSLCGKIAETVKAFRLRPIEGGWLLPVDRRLRQSSPERTRRLGRRQQRRATS
jgi:hypothetical protein